jgi:predicted pyridoxine 5'-phosphate oxidase superfamily flavin-nucleotide-binding protein
MSWRTRDEILHEGEQQAQDRYASKSVWPERALNRMFMTEFEPGVARFLEMQPFFFIATSDREGNCDASFRSTEPGPDGRLQPSVKVVDRSTLVFPDYSGNNLFNSLGNILVNPHIGMLFIDFQHALRFRVNGYAEVVEDPDAFGDIWSTAHRYVRVTVDQVFGNCSKRIPTLVPAQ